MTMIPRLDKITWGNLYESVTKKIIADLEGGTLPWTQPWANQGVPMGMALNAKTKNYYRGMNALILWIVGMERGYASPYWMTLKQANDLGGHVRKGEHGETIYFAKNTVHSSEKARAAAEGDEERSYFLLRLSTVFNAAQVDGLPEKYYPKPVKKSEPVIIEEAERVVAATRADIRYGGDSAFYAPGPDFIQCPVPESFFEPINFHRTRFHELTHWTGHKSRLAREFAFWGKSDEGDMSYAREELVAEIGSAFLCASLGIVPTVRHADYLAHYLKLLKSDNHAIFDAARRASEAAEYILTAAGLRKAEPTDEQTVLEDAA